MGDNVISFFLRSVCLRSLGCLSPSETPVHLRFTRLVLIGRRSIEVGLMDRSVTKDFVPRAARSVWEWRERGERRGGEHHIGT